MDWGQAVISDDGVPPVEMGRSYEVVALFDTARDRGEETFLVYEDERWSFTEVMVHVDAGTANSAMAMHNARRGRLPLVLMNSFATRDRSLAALAGYPELSQDIAADFLARKTVHADDREFTASGDSDNLDDIRQQEATAATIFNTRVQQLLAVLKPLIGKVWD